MRRDAFCACSRKSPKTWAMSISPGAHAGQPSRRLGDAADEQLLERGSLPPVARHGLEAMIVALLALDVAIGAGADGMDRRLLLADRLHVFLRDDVLVADVLGEERRHHPLRALEAHHHRGLVGRLDLVEVIAKEIGGAADGIGLEALLDRVLDVLRGHLAEALVEHHARAQLERPRAHFARGLPLGGETGLIREGLRIALDERIVDVIPQGLLGLRVPPGQRCLGAPLADGDDQPIALRRGAGAKDEGSARREERGRSRLLEKDPPPGPTDHRPILRRLS